MPNKIREETSLAIGIILLRGATEKLRITSFCLIMASGGRNNNMDSFYVDAVAT